MFSYSWISTTSLHRKGPVPPFFHTIGISDRGTNPWAELTSGNTSEALFLSLAQCSEVSDHTITLSIPLLLTLLHYRAPFTFLLLLFLSLFSPLLFPFLPPLLSHSPLILPLFLAVTFPSPLPPPLPLPSAPSENYIIQVNISRPTLT